MWELWCYNLCLLVVPLLLLVFLVSSSHFPLLFRVCLVCCVRVSPAALHTRSASSNHCHNTWNQLTFSSTPDHPVTYVVKTYVQRPSTVVFLWCVFVRGLTCCVFPRLSSSGLWSQLRATSTSSHLSASSLPGSPFSSAMLLSWILIPSFAPFGCCLINVYSGLHPWVACDFFHTLHVGLITLVY